jgi:hypothetical protein
MIPTLAELLFYSLVVWRLSSLLSEPNREAGPFDILFRLRDLLGVKYTEMSDCAPTNVIAAALCCLWCTSLWVAAWLVLMLQQPALHLFAYSAGAILLQSLITGASPWKSLRKNA